MFWIGLELINLLELSEVVIMEQHEAPGSTSLLDSSSQSEKRNVYSCDHCALSFTIKSNQRRHQVQCYQNPKRAKGSRDFPCYDCGSVFSRADNLRSHKVHRKCSKEFESSAPDLIAESQEIICASQQKSLPHESIDETCNTPSRCFIDGCTTKLLPRTSLVNHFKTCHQEYEINDPVYFEFHGMTEFLQWKSEEEKRMSCSFFSKKGQVTTSVQIYYCQFNSDSNTPNKSPQKRLKQSIQPGIPCIAKIKVSLLLDKILVQYHPTHIHKIIPSKITELQSLSNEINVVPMHHEEDRGPTEDLCPPSQPILERHEKGMLISDNCAEEIIENTWCFQSETCQSTKYLVVRCEKDCTLDHCYLKCLSEACRGLCAHLYSCSCNDNHPLCKHLHKLHSLLVKQQLYPEGEQEMDQCNTFDLDCSETPLHGGNNFDFSRLEYNTELLLNFLSLAKAGQVSEDILCDIDVSLNTIALKLKDLTDS